MREKIAVYPGTGNADLFADRPVAIAVDFPDTTMPGGGNRRRPQRGTAETTS